MTFENVYSDNVRADAYDQLEFPGTYYLAFRDLPKLFAEHVTGRRALDFGCGAGRSTRFLQTLGYHVTGVDISEPMLKRARERDPNGDYRMVSDSTLLAVDKEQYELILSAFTFDNIPSHIHKSEYFKSFAAHLKPGGCMVNLVSAPEIYIHEWASFTTKDFPENRQAKNGDIVRIVMLDVSDRRAVEDIFCDDAAYLDLYRSAGLAVVATHRPLGDMSEPFAWVTETSISPWAIYVLRLVTDKRIKRDDESKN